MHAALSMVRRERSDACRPVPAPQVLARVPHNERRVMKGPVWTRRCVAGVMGCATLAWLQLSIGYNIVPDQVSRV